MSELRGRVAEIYARHAASVYRRALRLLGHDAEAREVLQDLFVSMLEHPEQLARAQNINAFLYGATTHACLNRLRNQRNRERLLVERPELGSAAAFEEPERIVRVRRTLAQLPSELAEVAVYYFVDGLSQQEIAELLSCSRRRVGDLILRLQAWGRAQEAECSVK